jgi:hypothetical protein
VLAPTLNPDDIVVMDNLPAHKGAAVRAAIEARGARADSDQAELYPAARK